MARFILVSLVSGSAFPSTVCSLDCTEIDSALRGLTALVALTLLPSANTEVVLMIHFSPSLVHAPSPNPPSASKFHERICLVTGSQPIHCVPRSSTPSFVSTVLVETMKLWSGAQAKETRASSL